MEYFGIQRATAQGMQQPRRDETTEEILPEEGISDGKTPEPQQDDVSTADSEDADRGYLLRQGSPTTKAYWISEGDLTNENCCARLRARNDNWHPSEQACRNVNKCLFCAAAAIKKAEERDGYVDEEAVAALCVHAQNKQWDPISSENIADNLLAFHRILGKNKFQKYISHFGGLRVDEARVKTLAARGELHKVYKVMKIDKKGRFYFLVVEDPTNAIYSAWLNRIAADKIAEWETTNDEVLADTVEAFLGLGYLTTVFPNYLLKYLPNPNEMWSRIESSMHFGADFRLYKFATTGTKRKGDTGYTMGSTTRDIVHQMAKTIKSDPNFTGNIDGQWMKRIFPVDDVVEGEPVPVTKRMRSPQFRR
jgi:hypothetical protein